MTAAKPNGDPLDDSFRVITYARVSEVRQARHGESIHAQPEVLRAYAEARGWQVLHELSDPGRSGRTAAREGFQELMDAVARLRPDAILVTRLSRFMRNTRLTLNAVHEMREMGVSLIATDEPIDTRQRGIMDMLLAILATMAEWESDRLSEYAKDTRRRLISQGKWPGGSPPYGYRYDADSKMFRPDPERAKVVRLIYDLYTQTRVGLNAVRRELRLRGIPSPRGNKVWGLAKLVQVLSNPVYTGLHAYNIVAEPLIDEATFRDAQHRRQTNRGLKPRATERWPLQGRFRCGICGSHMEADPAGGRPVYSCHGRRSHSTHYLTTGSHCTMPRLSAREVEGSLLGMLGECLMTPQVFAEAMERALKVLERRAEESGRDRAPFERSLADAEKELAEIERSRIRAYLPPDELNRMEREALSRRQAAHQALAEVSSDLAGMHETVNLLHRAQESLDVARAAGSSGHFTEAPLVWLTDVLPEPAVQPFDLALLSEDRLIHLNLRSLLFMGRDLSSEILDRFRQILALLQAAL